MILEIVFTIIFFGLGAWFGYNRAHEKFGAMMERGEVMYKVPDFGWMGHPDAFKEIKEQEHEWDTSEIRLMHRVVNKTIKRIKKDRKGKK
jgi:hypothetical protein